MERREFVRALFGAGLLTAGGGPLCSTFADAAPTTQPTSQPALRYPHLGFPSGLKSLLGVKPKGVKHRIAILTDPHFALRDKSFDFKALRYSPWITQQHFAMIQAMGRITGRKVDLLLVPGDLTRDSEPWNHLAMRQMLHKCPFPSLVIPGNHDVTKKWMPKQNWGMSQFVKGYQGKRGGYDGKQQYYAVEALPGVLVIGLNSSDTPDGALRSSWNGRVDDVQLKWFANTVAKYAGKKLILVQVHHPLLHHHPAEKETSKHLWRNFHTDNSADLLKVMARYKVPLVFTGHHHINHIIKHPSLPITEVCTAGACSYPSNFRILDIHAKDNKATIHTIGIPWRTILTQIANAASHKREKFWRLPDKPNDPNAMLQFLAGRPQDRFAVLDLPKPA